MSTVTTTYLTECQSRLTGSAIKVKRGKNKEMWVAIFVIVLVIIPLIIFLTPPKPKIKVVPSQQMNNSFMNKGLAEFSSNFDVEWLDTFERRLLSTEAQFEKKDFDSIKRCCQEVYGDKFGLRELSLSTRIGEIPCETYVVIEWCNVMGYILRIYSPNKNIISIMEEEWVKTTKELGV